MRILFANNYYYLRGGAERVLFTEMNLLRANGHEVGIFSTTHPENEKTDFDKYFVEYHDYFQNTLWQKAKSALNIIYSVEAARKFEILVKAFKPDLIHAHNIYGRISCSIIDVAKKYSLPIYLTAHDLKIVCPTYLMLNHGEVCERCLGHKYYNCLLTKCHKDSYVASAIYTAETYLNYILKKYENLNSVLCPSLFLKEKLKDRIDETKLLLLRNPQTFQPTDKCENEGYYLYVGRLSLEKGVERLVDVFKYLKQELWIVGAGPLESVLRKKIEGFKNIRLLGPKTTDDLGEIYRKCYFCVVPSEVYENSPMTVIEAMSYSKPVIASDIGGIPELISDRINGFLFKAFNSESLLEKIIHTTSLEVHEYEKMSLEALNSVREKYSPKAHCEKLIDIYQEGINKRPESVSAKKIT